MNRLWLILLLSSVFPAMAGAVPTAVPYSGQLAESGTLVDGTRAMTLVIYDSDTDGNALYTQFEPAVTVTNGVYHINLNAPSTVWNGSDRWLGVAVDGGAELTPRTKIGSVPYAARAYAWSKTIYSWNVFSTYDNASTWLAGNDPLLFGGVSPYGWTDADATAGQISSDKEVLRTLFTQKGYGGANALVYADVRFQYSSTDGRVVVCLFRIKNTSDAPIVWTPFFHYTAYSGWNERASVALNGVDAWTSGGGAGTQSASVDLSIPENRTSTVIFVSTGSAPYTVSGSLRLRQCLLAFYNNSLQLPAGLQYVDDLDAATGGWEQ